MAIPLGPASPRASRDRPGRPAWEPACAARLKAPHRRPYLVLLPVGFTVPPALPPARCALAAPFHPCPQARPKPAPAGGLLSVALSLGSPPPGITRHRVPVEPGLSSPAEAGAAIRPPDAEPYVGASSGPHKAATAASRAMVSSSRHPSQWAGRKRRWNARSATSIPTPCAAP